MLTARARKRAAVRTSLVGLVLALHEARPSRGARPSQMRKERMVKAEKLRMRL